jgi:hypothetical protein
LKIKFLILFFALVIFTGLYGGAWQYGKTRIDHEIARLFADAQKNDIALLGDQPRVQNFPFVPTIRYTDGIRFRGGEVTFPEVIVEGFPIPGLPVRAVFAHGAMITINNGRNIFMPDEIDAALRIPVPVPRSFSETDMRAWQQAGGTLDIIDAFVRYEGAQLHISGKLMLDGTLQPAGTLKARISGYAPLLQKMIEMEKIKPFAGFALMAALNNFTLPDPDPVTGEQVAELPITIRDQSVYVGPVLVGSLQPIAWDTHIPPAPHQ